MGRTKETWLPRRLGGGKGGEKRRAVKADQLVREVERELRYEQRAQQEKTLKKPEEQSTEKAKRPEPADEREPGEL